MKGVLLLCACVFKHLDSHNETLRMCRFYSVTVYYIYIYIYIYTLKNEHTYTHTPINDLLLSSFMIDKFDMILFTSILWTTLSRAKYQIMSPVHELFLVEKEQRQKMPSATFFPNDLITNCVFRNISNLAIYLGFSISNLDWVISA